MNPDPDQLKKVFSGSGWARFIGVLREHRDSGRPFPAVVSLKEASEVERRYHGRLLRLPAPSKAGTLRYDLARLASALGGSDLSAFWTEVLKAVCGEISQARLAANAAKKAWDGFWPEALASLRADPFPSCMDWMAGLQRDGSLKRQSKGDVAVCRRWFAAACKLLRALPLADEQPLAAVAVKYCGDSHALDPGSALATTVSKNLALRQGRTSPVRSDERRALWASFGVVCDDLSSPVLTFNLGLSGKSLVCDLVHASSAELQPVHLTSRLIWSTIWDKVICPPVAYVFENPTMVALAVARLQRGCPPLICTDGEPKTATRLLLSRFRERGTRLYYHGDFDWPGLSIAGRVIEEFGAIPWYFDEAAYRNAAGRFESRSLEGRAVPSPWSPALCSAMSSNGLAFDEELLAEELFESLAEARLDNACRASEPHG